MDDCMTEKMCEEKHTNLAKQVDRIGDDVNKILILWNGNGDTGAGYKVNTMWSKHKITQKSNQGLMDWFFRAVLMILVTYIAIRLGLK